MGDSFSEMKLLAGEAKSSGKHESFCKVHLYNLTSIIMDEVRHFVKFTIAQAKMVLSR